MNSADAADLVVRHREAIITHASPRGRLLGGPDLLPHRIAHLWKRVVEKVLETAATQDLWSRALDRIKGKLPDSSFEMWFSEVRARGSDDGGIELILPSDYIRSWLASHYAELIADAVSGAAGA